MIEQIVSASDNAELYLHSWCVEEPKAAVLLAHGMAEHSMRYAGFAEFLNASGISFYCHEPGAWIGLAHTHNSEAAESYVSETREHFPGFDVHMDRLPISIA
ncbi:MAG: alpha/beta hydrolase, partial [Peptococcaceae bacterium]|nr:alpha/beta hydrolase [Peptococcaceae bacterium]